MYKKIRRLVHFKHQLKRATQGLYMWSLVHLALAGLLSWWNRYILSFVAIKVVFPRWNKPHVRRGNILIYYHYPDMRLYIFLDFGYSDIVTWQEGWLLLVFKAAFTVMWCDHPNITECFYNCSFITSHYIHITVSYISKSHGVNICESTRSHPYNSAEILICYGIHEVIWNRFKIIILRPYRLTMSQWCHQVYTDFLFWLEVRGLKGRDAWLFNRGSMTPKGSLQLLQGGRPIIV